MSAYIKKYIPFAVLGVLFMILEVTMDLLQPDYMKRIVDEGVLGVANGGADGFELILKLGFSMVGIALVGGFCGSMNNVLVNYSSQNIGNLMRKDTFRRVLSFSFPQIDNIGTGPLITRITNDITQIEMFVSMFVRGMVRTSLLFLGSLYCLFRLNTDFGWLALGSVPFILGSMIYCIAKVDPLYDAVQDNLDNLNSILQEDISGIRIIKACVREIYEKIRFGKANDELIKKQLKILVILAFLHPVSNGIMCLVVGLMLWKGNSAVVAGTATPGTIMAAVTYTTQLLHSILMIVMIFQSISRGMTSWRRVRRILNTEPEIVSATEAVNSTENAGSVEFRNVSFAYNKDDRMVLENINLKIEAGKTIAIMGITGSGKSSLINLIPRFYDANSGEVLVDGVNVKNYNLTELRNKIAIVLQKSELFSDTIANNIKWGNPEAEASQVEKSAKIAQAAEFIENISDKYESVVAERGMSLSGGQRQRVSIARAVLKPAEILIFDDSTSALDLRTEALFYDALKEARPNTTKIIVAQRVASVRRADEIVLLENGSICACGSHDELMNSCAAYRDIYASQMGEEAHNG